MKKIYFIAASMLMAASAFAAEGDTYWYIRGPFNDYNPDYKDKWALMDDDQGDANTFTGTFEVAAGEFKINLMNPDGNVFVPMMPSMEAYNATVTFIDNVYNGTSTLAWDDYEENYYWIDDAWEGGQITVSVYASSNNPKITIYAIPKQAVGGDDLYTITGPLDDIITITFENYWTWPAGNGAYIQPENGEKIELVRYSNGMTTPYQIVINEDDMPGSIEVNIKDLELSAGNYTLVIPEGYVDLVTEDYDFESNPEIIYPFTLGNSKINAIDTELNAPVIYNLQGQKVNGNINGLSKGIYVINGKKVIIR